jgi:hypothetical protein
MTPMDDTMRVLRSIAFAALPIVVIALIVAGLSVVLTAR